MKKLLIAFASFAIAGVAIAGLDAYEVNNFNNLLLPQAITDGAAVTGSAVSVKSAKGRAALVFSFKGSSTGTSHNASIQLQESPNGSTAWSNVTDSVASVTSTNAGALNALEVDVATLSTYVRVVATSTGGADTVSAVLISPK